ncbi:MAG: hypothetical protein GKR87_03960 [Kiritimatiellae bacterium]|nr:hypothetical protein [Kiritimatiellia bacterium]
MNTIRNRSWLDLGDASDLSKLDIEAIKRVKVEAWPQAQIPDELHDVLSIHGFILEEEGQKNQWDPFFTQLVSESRAAKLQAGPNRALWIATKRIPLFQTVFPDTQLYPVFEIPHSIMQEKFSFEDALKEIIRGQLEALGPVQAEQLTQDIGMPLNKTKQALLTLETEGFVFRGNFAPDLRAEEWCERRLLQRIHKYTIDSLRQSIEPVRPQDFMQFLFAYHHMRADDKQTGPDTLQKVLDQLEGIEAPAVAWESDILPARIADYDPSWLDVLCMSGKIA